MSEDLAARLSRFERERAIEQTLFDYCSAIDRHDQNLLEQIFDRAAVLHLGDKNYVGKDSIVETLVSYFPRREWARHFLTNTTFLDAADLRTRSYFLFIIASSPTRVLGCGTYDAIFKADQDRMRLIDLRVSIDASGNAP
jgi:hypothetical protein